MLWKSFPQDLSEALHFAALDAHAAVAVPDRVIASVDSTAIDAMVGSSTTGERLVLWQAAGASTTGHGVWLASNGTPAASFVIEGLFSPSASGGSGVDSFGSLANALRPLADGTLALRVDGVWRGTLAAGATSLGRVPRWLQGADGEELAMVAGGRGYALYPEITEAGACTASVRLIDITGAACGTETLDLKSASCNTYRGTQIVLGAAGTFFAFLPTWDPHLNEVSGVVRRWPALLR